MASGAESIPAGILLVAVKLLIFRLLESATCRALATTTATLHGEITLFSLAGFGFAFFRALLFTLGAISYVFPARAVDIIHVFFFKALVVLKS